MWVPISFRRADRARRSAALAGAVMIATVAFLVVTTRAEASETVYWDNYEGNSIAFSAIDGSGGGILDLGGERLEGTEGMAFDPANGRMYVAGRSDDKIFWVAVDGSGGGVLETPGVTMEQPNGITIDPRTQIIYWANDPRGPEGQENPPEGTIDWAHLDGSGGGVLDIGGAQALYPSYPAIDTADNRIYWVNSDPFFRGFGWASLDGSGGGELLINGGPSPYNVRGINVDPESGRLFWLDLFSDFEQSSVERIGWVNLSGVGGGEIDASGTRFEAPYGMAFDPTTGDFYWGNWGNGIEREAAIGTLSRSGVGGGITPVAAPVSGPQYPVVLKSPTGTKPPQVTHDGPALSCSQGSWSQDYPGSFVYGAPTSYSYQWLSNGTPITGATTSSYVATAPGGYSCSVTGRNVSGSGSQTSSTVTVSGAAFSLALQTQKVTVKAGKPAKVTVQVSNGGDLASSPVQACAVLDKKAKRGLRPPNCVWIGALGHGGAATATLHIQTKKGAKGTFKFPVQVEGASPSSVTATVKLTAPKKKHR